MMKKHVLIEILCFLLMANFFYEGVYKIAYFGNWEFWITGEPIMKPIAVMLKYAIPAIEIILSLLLFSPSYRAFAVYGIICLQFIFIFWVMSVYFFTHYLFWPYHALWDKPTWMQKLIYALFLSWLAYAVIIISRKVNSKNGENKKLRNELANSGQ